jgi:hypothetical protein
MNSSNFAKHLGVSHVAVHKAIAGGDLDGAISWIPRGKIGKKYAEIVDLPRAVELWKARRGACAPALGLDGGQPRTMEHGPPVDQDGEVIDIAEARLRYETARAKNEELAYQVASGKLISVASAMDIFGRQIAEAKTAIMALGKHARSRIPHLSVDDVVTIEELCRDALEGLAAGAIQRQDTGTEGRT